MPSGHDLDARCPAAFRRRGVTLNRGKNVAAPSAVERPCPASGAVTRMWRIPASARKTGDLTGKDGRSECAPEPPSSSEATVSPDELAASPPGRCYSRRLQLHRVTHRAEGGSQPEGPGSSPSRRHALITPGAKRPLKSGLPAVTEVSSTETSDAEERLYGAPPGAAAQPPRRRHSPMRCSAISRRRGKRRCSNR